MIVNPTRPRRAAAVAAATVALLFVSVFMGAGPASAATSSTKFYFSGGTYVDDSPSGGSIRGSGSAIVLSTGWKTRYYGHESKPKFVVQQYIKGKWKTVKHVKTGFVSSRGAIAKLPVHTVPSTVLTEVVKYRFKSVKRGAVKNTDTSKTITVHFDNQLAYTGLAKIAYDTMAPWCPTAAVREDPTLKAQGFAGLYSTTKSISIDSDVATYPVENQAAVALHECAHLRQYYNYGATQKGYIAGNQAAAAVFVADTDPAGTPNDGTTPPAEGPTGVFNPREHGADCSSHAIRPAGYLGYGGYCNPNELAEGLRLMQGFKY